MRRVQRYAVDGVLHYAKSLAKEFNVIAVAVCGAAVDSATMVTCLHTKNTTSPKLLRTKDAKDIAQMISWSDYIEHATFDPSVQKLRSEELVAFSRDMHIFMRDHAKLTENEKPLVVSGTLIALRNKAFAMSYDARATAS